MNQRRLPLAILSQPLLYLFVCLTAFTTPVPPIEPADSSASFKIIHQIPVPTTFQRLTRRAVYTASPSIAILPDGSYLVTLNHFGHGSTASTSGLTFVYQSLDRGNSWNRIATIDDMKRGSLFVHPNGNVFLLGYRAAPGDIVIRRSDDGGHSWSTPDDDQTGLLRKGNFGGTPNRGVIYGERVWFAVGGTRFFSAPVNSDWLKANSWTMSASARIDQAPVDGNLIITEAQITASDTIPPTLMPKVGGHALTVLIHSVNSPRKIQHPSIEDWVAIPGGEKKFAAAWDPGSGYFIALTNPVLPKYADSGWPPELIRNVGALVYSKDLREWHMAHIFIQSPHVDYEAFQYFSFDFDDEDLIIASRTALHIENRKPPRGHDSNMITFHRIAGFRGLLSR